MTPAQVRAEFWRRHRGVPRIGKRQRPFSIETWTAWIEFLDSLMRDGQLDEDTACECTLLEERDE